MSALDSYLDYFKNIPRLNDEENKDLEIKIIQGDLSAREKLIGSHLRLVVHLAKKYSRNGSELEDLISVGNIGLIRAVDKIKPGKKTKFSSYCKFWIKGTMVEWLARSKHLVPIPLRELRRNNYKYQYLPTLNFDLKVDDENSLGDFIEDKSQNILNYLIKKEEISLVKKHFANLGFKQKLVLNYRFGIDGGKLLRFKEVEKQCGISPKYANAIQKKGIEWLKEKLEKEYFSD